MFGIGSTELVVILVIALLVLGPKNLPKAARTVGKVMGEFRRVSTEFQRTINTEIALEEKKDAQAAEAPASTAASTAAPASAATATGEGATGASAAGIATASKTEDGTA